MFIKRQPKTEEEIYREWGEGGRTQEWANIELTFDSLILEKVHLLVQLLSHANPRDATPPIKKWLKK